jgi:hypothetical protein
MKQRLFMLPLVIAMIAVAAGSGKLMLAHHMHALTQRDQIRYSKLPKGDLNEIIAALVKRVKQEDCSEDWKKPLRNEVRTYRVEKVSLSPESQGQFIVHGWGPCACSATGNCTAWVLERRGNNFRTLLADGGFNGYSVEDSATNGYKDLIFSSHDSASSQVIDVYRFDGRKYQRYQCYLVSSWAHGRPHKLKRPDITRMRDCE